jgi:hypothetical protein
LPQTPDPHAHALAIAAVPARQARAQEEPPKWLQQAKDVRRKLAAGAAAAGATAKLTSAILKGRPWTAPAGVPAPRCRGLAGGARQRELLDIAYLSTCLANGSDPFDITLRQQNAHGLTCDVSQSINRSPWSHHLRTITTASRIYSFQHDRLLHGEELFRCYGWEAQVDGLAADHTNDLVGETMALPPLMAALTGLAVSAGLPLPGLLV